MTNYNDSEKMDIVLTFVCKELFVNKDDVKQINRKIKTHDLVQARYIFYGIVKEMFNENHNMYGSKISYPKMAQFLKQDHSTVNHAIECINNPYDLKYVFERIFNSFKEYYNKITTIDPSNKNIIISRPILYDGRRNYEIKN